MRKLMLMLAGLALLCPAAIAQTTAPAPDARVKKLLDARKVDYEITRGGNFFYVTFTLRSGRKQGAFISSATYRYMDMELREIVSPAYRSAAPFTAEVADRLLSDNHDKKLGAWAMRKEEDGYYALFVSTVPAESGEDAFFAALLRTLDTADEMEKELTEKDEF